MGKKLTKAESIKRDVAALSASVQKVAALAVKISELADKLE